MIDLISMLRRISVAAILLIILAACSVTVSVNDNDEDTGETLKASPIARTELTPPAIPPSDESVDCSTTVSEVGELQDAVNDAKASDVVCLAGGEYQLEDTVLIRTSGERDSPITLRSAPGEAAIIIGPDSDPGIELVRANWWVLTDLEFTGGDILLRLNGSRDNEITRTYFHDAGGECVRIRDQSQRNRFTDNVVVTCGLEGFNLEEDSKNGEGVYIGTAPEQRERIGGEPDQSNENVIEGNWFHTNAAEAVDIKEDSEFNVVRDNIGVGSRDPDGGIFGSRGDNNQFLYNEAFGGAGAGFRTGGDAVAAGEHGQVEDRFYGKNNVLRGNDARENENYGYRFMAWPQDVDCTNTGSGNGEGLFYVDDEDVTLACAEPSGSPAVATVSDDEAEEPDEGTTPESEESDSDD